MIAATVPRGADFETVNKNVTVIPNFIIPAIQQSKPAKRNPVILTIANLIPIKGIDLLLQAAELVLHRHPEWRWKIIGDGENKTLVNDFIISEKLQDRLILQLPVNHDLSSEYLEVSILALTSRSESFGMVLLEAMNFGLPCVSFDCETGPRHIIQDNVTGLLVRKEDSVSLAEAISLLISNEEKRNGMGKNSLDNVRDFYPKKVYALWKQLFQSEKFV